MEDPLVGAGMSQSVTGQPILSTPPALPPNPPRGHRKTASVDRASPLKVAPASIAFAALLIVLGLFAVGAGGEVREPEPGPERGRGAWELGDGGGRGGAREAAAALQVRPRVQGQRAPEPAPLPPARRGANGPRAPPQVSTQP